MKCLLFYVWHTLAILLFSTGLGAQVVQDVIISRSKPSEYGQLGVTVADLPPHVSAGRLHPTSRALSLQFPILAQQKASHLLLQYPNGKEILLAIPSDKTAVLLPFDDGLQGTLRYSFLLEGHLLFSSTLDL